MIQIVFEDCERDKLLFFATIELSSEELIELLLEEEYNYEDIILNIDNQDRYMHESGLKQIVREKLEKISNDELSQYVRTFSSDEVLVRVLYSLSDERVKHLSEND